MFKLNEKASSLKGLSVRVCTVCMHADCLHACILSVHVCTVTLPLLTKEPFLNFPVVCVWGGMMGAGGARDLGWPLKTGRILTCLIQTRKDKNIWEDPCPR